MTSNVRMILNEVNARIKLAEAKTAEDPSNFDSFPGAENDKAVAEEMKNPDPEVKDEGPASRTETTGAEPGSDVPLQQDHLYEADEPVLTPEKKPAESDDANAKEASADVQKVAADILGVIKGALNKKEEKKASDSISLESRILDKIASVKRAEEAGALDAINLIKAASEYNRGAADAEALIQKIAQAMEDTANSADAAEEGIAPVDNAEAAGAADAEAAIADAVAADEASEAPSEEAGIDDEVTPEEVVEAVNDLVSEGQISEEEAAALVNRLEGEVAGDASADEVTEEQLAEGIAKAIESGELSEDEAQQLVQELVDAGADESLEEAATEDAMARAEEAGAEDAAAAIDAAQKQAAAAEIDAVKAELHEKVAEVLEKKAEDIQIAKYQRGFIQKCAEYGADPQKVAQYIQSRVSGQL